MSKENEKKETVSVFNVLGYGKNGKEKTIVLNERQVDNLLRIIKCYKDELCCDNQEINECKELIKLISEQNK